MKKLLLGLMLLTSTLSFAKTDIQKKVENNSLRIEKLENMLIVGDGVDAVKKYLDSKNITFSFSNDYSEEEIKTALTTLKSCFTDIENTYPDKMIDVDRIWFSESGVAKFTYSYKQNTLGVYIGETNRAVPTAKQCKDKVVSEALINKN